MARLIGPDMGSRAVFLPGGRLAAGKTGVVYADAAGTSVANIAAYQPGSPGIPGSVITGGAVTVDSYGLLPLFWFPDGVDRVWVSVNSGPLVPIDADYNARIDSLRAAVDVIPGGHNTALRKWYATLAGRYGSIASIVVIGDSNSEGTGASSVHRRWQQVLQNELRACFQPPGVAGATIPYITASPRHNPAISDYPVTVTGGPLIQQSYGLGLRAADVRAGQSVTFTFTGTRVKLMGTKGPAVGKYGISLDGGAVVVVDGFNSAVLSGQVVADSGVLAAGTHTMTVTRDASTTLNPGYVLPEGLRVYNGDEFAGVRVVDAAQHGLTVGAFNQNLAWQTAFSAIENKGLLIMPWGANDAVVGTTPAAFRSGLETLIANARAAGFAGSTLLVKMPKRGTATEQAWVDILAQIDAVAAADPDITTLDLRSRMPDHGTAEATALGIYTDEVHYNAKGQALIADQIATAILPR